MALTKYTEKRNFKESPEPTGGNPDSEQLRFVIQKHDARNLHYDLQIYLLFCFFRFLQFSHRFCFQSS